MAQFFGKLREEGYGGARGNRPRFIELSAR
jgi:hypothetical protein